MLFAWILANSLVQEPTPIFAGSAMPVWKIVRELEHQGAKSLTVDAKIRSEVVFIRSSQEGLSAVKAKLASALNATWVKEPSSEVLRRLPAQDKELLEQHRTRRLKEVNKAMEAARLSLKEPFDARTLAQGLADLKPAASDDRQGQIRVSQLERKLFAQGPAARLLKSLLLACKPEDLAAIGPYERGVFTIHPTKKQYGFDKARFDAVARQFAKEQSEWVEAAAAVAFPKNSNGGTVSDPRLQTQIAPDAAQAVHLNVVRGDMTGLFLVNLVADDGLATLAQDNVADSAREFLDGQMTPEPADPNDPVVKYTSKATEDLIKHAQAMFGVGGEDAMSPELQFVLQHPDEVDPQDLVVADTFRAYAAKVNKNVVAWLSDDAFNWLTFMAVQRPLRAQAGIDGLVRSGTLTKDENGNWLIYRPLDSVTAKAGFTPREAMATLVQTMTRKGSLFLSDYASYAFATHRINRSGLGEVWLMLLDRSYGSMLDHTDWNGLKLYGSLTPEQQRAMEGGAEYRLMTLSPEQRSICERVVYGRELRSESFIDNGTTQQLSASIEPTEAFPNGLPDHGTLSAKVKSMPIIYAYGKGTDGTVRPLRSVNEATIAAIETQVVGKADQMAQYGVKGLVGYAMGGQKTVLLRVNLDKGLWREFTIMEPVYDPNAKPGKWSELPKTQADLVQGYIKQNGRGATGGGVIPPRR